MNRVPLQPAHQSGPLFISRGLLLLASLTLWCLSIVAAALAPADGDAGRLTFVALSFDFAGLVVAFFASHPTTPERILPWLRLLWLATSFASGIQTAQTVTTTSGYPALALNVLLGTSLVFLVAMRWDVLGFLVLISANSVLSGVYYATTPRLGSGDGLLIFFITLLPGLLGALTVFVLRSMVEERAARETLRALQTLTEHADARATAVSGEMAETHRHIQELFAKVAETRKLSLHPELSEQAQELAQQLRTQLTVQYSTNWLTESLALAGMESQVVVVAQPDLLEYLPQESRSAVLASTMLLATTPVQAAKGPDSRLPAKLHLYIEPHLDGTVLITWRVARLNPQRCTPAFWTELGSLGVPRVQTDPGGASITVRTKAPKPW